MNGQSHFLSILENVLKDLALIFMTDSNDLLGITLKKTLDWIAYTKVSWTSLFPHILQPYLQHKSVEIRSLPSCQRTIQDLSICSQASQAR